MPSGANAITQKGNVVLYLDKELAIKSKELGFNLQSNIRKSFKTTDFTAIKQPICT